jgi:hypothetical protein
MGPKEFKDMMDYLTRPRMADGERLKFSSGKRVGFRDEGLARFANPGLGKGILKRAKERIQFVKQGLLDDYSNFFKNRKLFENEKYVPNLEKLREKLNTDPNTIKKVIKELPKNIQKNIQLPKVGGQELKGRGLTDDQLKFFAKNYKDKSLMQMTQELIGDKNINYENPKFKNLYSKLFRFNKFLVDRGVIEGVPRTFAKKMAGVPELRNKGQAFRKYEEAQKALMKLDPKTYGKYNTPAGLDSALKKMINYKQVKAATGNLPDDLLLSFEHYQGLTPGFITQDPTALSKVGLTGRKYNWQIMGKDGKYSPYTTVKRYLATAKELIKKNKMKEAKEALKKVNIVYDDIQKELKTVGRKELPKYNIKNNKIIEANLKGVFKQQTLDKSFEGYFKNIAGFATKEDLAAVKKVQPNVAKVLNLYQQGKAEEASSFIKKRVPQITETTKYGNIAIKPGEIFSKVPGITDLFEVAKTIPGDIAKKSYLKAGFKTLGIAATPLVIFDTYKAFEQGKPVLESLEQGFLGTNLIGGTKDILSLNPEERMARSVVKQDALKDLNLDMPMGFGFIEGPTPQTNMTLPEAQQKMDAGIQRVQQERAQRESDIAANRANLLGNLKSRIFDIGGIGQDYQLELAGGGIAKEAGDPSGAMLESMNPDSQGLPGLLKRVRNR